MFIICFGNGLGNQMFQYAFYLAMKNKYPNADIKMDINYIQCNAHNGFELERIFHIPMNNVATHLESLRLSYFYPGKGIIPAIIRRIYKVYDTILPHKNHYHFNDGTQYHPEMFNLDEQKDYLLDGTWVNEKYFIDIKDKVIDAFHFNLELNHKNKKYLLQIQNSNSVSLHIRRGDYVEAGFYLLDKKYYDAALDFIREKVSNLKLFIFTDDYDWVKKNIHFTEDMIIITGNTAPNNYIDMYLMSQCKHNIIANSSFSFWGAYLNKNKDKIVVAPNALEKNSANALVAEGWITIDVKG